jgi:alkylated DNA repair dioxygenase AlkB
MNQIELFPPERILPDGFRYQPELISPEAERRLVAAIRDLPLQPFEFHAHTGKRRVVSFGHHYDFSHESLRPTTEIPAFLQDLGRAAADFARLPPAALAHALVTEYAAGAGIGWHRDKAVFGQVIGISLLSSCRLRLRRRAGATWERVAVAAEPRSAYLLSGPARDEWEHSIPEVETLRYSVTFRTLASPR